MGRPGKSVLHYWDACLFIDLLNGTPGRIDTLRNLWSELHDPARKVIAVTSVLTIAEVVKSETEKLQHKLDPEARKKIDSFWRKESPVQLVEAYQRVVEDARDLMRQTVEWTAGDKLKPFDAIHLATAKRRGCRRFLTYDSRLQALDGKLGIAIEFPRCDLLPFKEGDPPSE